MGFWKKGWPHKFILNLSEFIQGNNYAGRILPFFCPPPCCFMFWVWTKNGQFLNPSPLTPHLVVYIVIECFLTYLKLPCIDPSFRCNEKIQVISSVKYRMFEIHGNSANMRKKISVAMQDKRLLYQVKRKAIIADICNQKSSSLNFFLFILYR